MPDFTEEIGSQQFYLVADPDDTSPAAQLVSENESSVLWSVAQDGTVTAKAFVPTTKPTVTGSKGGNAALTSLMTALVALGLVTDTTS